MLKLAGVVAICAAAAFGAAFLIARSGNSAPSHTARHPKPVALGDPAATAVALRFTGRPAPLKLPPKRRVKHRPKVTVTATPAPAPTPTPTPAPTYTPTVPTYTPPPAPTPKRSGGGGTGVGTGTTTSG